MFTLTRFFISAFRDIFFGLSRLFIYNMLSELYVAFSVINLARYSIGNYPLPHKGLMITGDDSWGSMKPTNILDKPPIFSMEGNSEADATKPTTDSSFEDEYSKGKFIQEEISKLSKILDSFLLLNSKSNHPFRNSALLKTLKLLKILFINMGYIIQIIIRVTIM